MTTHYIGELGLKKCREILSGAGEKHSYFNLDLKQWQQFSKPDGELVFIAELRTELAIYDQDDFTHLANHITPLTNIEDGEYVEKALRGEHD